MVKQVDECLDGNTTWDIQPSVGWSFPRSPSKSDPKQYNFKQAVDYLVFIGKVSMPSALLRIITSRGRFGIDRPSTQPGSETGLFVGQIFKPYHCSVSSRSQLRSWSNFATFGSAPRAQEDLPSLLLKHSTNDKNGVRGTVGESWQGSPRSNEATSDRRAPVPQAIPYERDNLIQRNRIY